MQNYTDLQLENEFLKKALKDLELAIDVLQEDSNNKNVLLVGCMNRLKSKSDKYTNNLLTDIQATFAVSHANWNKTAALTKNIEDVRRTFIVKEKCYK